MVLALMLHVYIIVPSDTAKLVRLYATHTPPLGKVGVVILLILMLSGKLHWQYPLPRFCPRYEQRHNAQSCHNTPRTDRLAFFRFL